MAVPFRKSSIRLTGNRNYFNYLEHKPVSLVTIKFMDGPFVSAPLKKIEIHLGLVHYP